jgi:hypothetical protein
LGVPTKRTSHAPREGGCHGHARVAMPRTSRGNMPTTSVGMAPNTPKTKWNRSIGPTCLGHQFSLRAARVSGCIHQSAAIVGTLGSIPCFQQAEPALGEMGYTTSLVRRILVVALLATAARKNRRSISPMSGRCQFHASGRGSVCQQSLLRSSSWQRLHLGIHSRVRMSSHSRSNRSPAMIWLWERGLLPTEKLLLAIPSSTFCPWPPS